MDDYHKLRAALRWLMAHERRISELERANRPAVAAAGACLDEIGAAKG